MNPVAIIADVIGGLIPTGLVTLLLIALFKRVWVYNSMSTVVANLISAAFCVWLGTMASGNNNFGLMYLIPQSLVLIVTVWMSLRRQHSTEAN